MEAKQGNKAVERLENPRKQAAILGAESHENRRAPVRAFISRSPFSSKVKSTIPRDRIWHGLHAPSTFPSPVTRPIACTTNRESFAMQPGPTGNRTRELP